MISWNNRDPIPNSHFPVLSLNLQASRMHGKEARSPGHQTLEFNKLA